MEIDSIVSKPDGRRPRSSTLNADVEMLASSASSSCVSLRAFRSALTDSPKAFCNNNIEIFRERKEHTVFRLETLASRAQKTKISRIQPISSANRLKF